MSSGGNQLPECYVTKLESDYSKLTKEEKRLILNVYGNLRKHFVCKSQEAVSKTAKLCAIKYRLVAKIIEDFDLGLLNLAPAVEHVKVESHPNDKTAVELGEKVTHPSFETSRECGEQRPATEAAALDTRATQPADNRFSVSTEPEPILPNAEFVEVTNPESSPCNAPDDHEMPADSTISTPAPLVVIPGNVATNGQPCAGLLIYNQLPVHPNVYYLVQEQLPGVSFPSPAVGFPSSPAGFSSPAVGCSSPAVGFSSSAAGFSSPAVGCSSPAVGFSSSAVGFSSPAVGCSSPAVGFSSSSPQSTSQAVADVLDTTAQTGYKQMPLRSWQTEFICQCCTEVFTCQQSYGDHLTSAHSRGARSVPGNRWITCRQCSLSMPGNVVINHVIRLHRVGQRRCDFCDNVYPMPHGLVMHIKETHAYDFLCRYGMQESLDT